MLWVCPGGLLLSHLSLVVLQVLGVIAPVYVEAKRDLVLKTRVTAYVYPGQKETRIRAVGEVCNCDVSVCPLNKLSEVT